MLSGQIRNLIKGKGFAMRFERTKNAGRNILYGGALKIYQILFPFLIRTVMISYMGMEYIGLSGLFVSILQVLNLAELGIGSAMVFSMYKPIAENDDATICALMKLYRKYYRIVGTVVLLGGVAAVPFLPHLIKGDVPDGLNLYILYSINLAATVLSYWMFAYKSCILSAYQRNDISSKIIVVTTTIEYITQLIVIICFHNYYYYLLARVLSQILQNIITALIASKMFPQYSPKGELDKESVTKINNSIRDLFTAKVGGVIVNSVDTLVISAFLGLYVLGVYNNYFYILTSIISIMYVVFGACTAGIGNSLVTESTDKNYFDFQVFSLIICWISGFCTCCFLCLYQPFMLLWIKDENKMFGMPEVVCFCVYFFVYEIAAMMIQYKDAAGIWHEDRYRPLITALSNLIMNIIMVRYIGVLGILLSTILSFLIIGIPWLVWNIFKYLFKRSSQLYVKKLLIYALIVTLSCFCSYGLCSFVLGNGFISLLIRVLICFVVSNGIYWVVFHKTQEYNHMIIIVERIIGIIKGNNRSAI